VHSEVTFLLHSGCPLLSFYRGSFSITVTVFYVLLSVYLRPLTFIVAIVLLVEDYLKKCGVVMLLGGGDLRLTLHSSVKASCSMVFTWWFDVRWLLRKYITTPIKSPCGRYLVYSLTVVWEICWWFSEAMPTMGILYILFLWWHLKSGLSCLPGISLCLKLLQYYFASCLCSIRPTILYRMMCGDAFYHWCIYTWTTLR
jgi:hypothetical protein